MIGETLSGRFRIERLLGRGGMSSVWQAYDEELGRPVAIKLLHARRLESADSVDRFEREARTLALLAHPGIVTVIDRGETDGRPFIVCELVDGRDLHERIALEGPLPIAEALAIAVQIAAALAYAHERGVIHRDVKPHNVLLTADGHAKLTDFGIARVDDAPALTNPGRVLGTGDYVAPEQAQGHPLDGRADIYALGALLYHCLTGGPPYRGASFVEIAEQHLRAPVPDVQARSPEISDGVAAIVSRALAKRREDRFADVGQMGAAVERELLALTRDEGSDTAEVPLVATALEVADPTATEIRPELAGAPSAGPATASQPTDRDAETSGGLAFAWDDDAQRPPKPARPRKGPGGRRIWPIALLLLVLLAGIGWGAYLGSSLIGGGEGSSTTTGTTGTTTAGTTAQTSGTTAGTTGATAVAGLTASSYDPTAGGGDGSEHPTETGNALDGNPSTSWRTDTYRGTAEFAGIKPGVGFVLSAPAPVTASALRLTGGLDGWTGRAYTAPGSSPPATIDGWKPVSDPFVARSVPMDIPLRAGPSRLYLIWITKLAPVSTGFAASIAEVSLQTAAKP
ncbi:MAG: eukaryotic-like serine/threonine-protein kinase [Gaiellales bacterium]|nr:eukaryotic-like serine/threonine-protein kinase [Gaiellales bacterium]